MTKSDKFKIAEQDMIVYKKVEAEERPLKRKTFTSIYRGFKWKIGVMQEAKIESITLNWDKKSFDKREDRDYGDVDYDDRVYIGPGLHSSISKSRLNVNKNFELLVECIIPKGAMYFINRSDLCVSNKLILVKPII